MNEKMILSKNSSKRGLYMKLLVKVYDYWNTKPNASKKDILEIKEVNLITSRLFCMNKNETFDILKVIEEFGYISFVKFGKIKLNYEVKDND